MIDLVLARTDAALDWLVDLPAHCRVQLCQAGDTPAELSAPASITLHRVHRDARTADSHLQYLRQLGERLARGDVPPLDPSGWTVFAPADAPQHLPALVQRLGSPSHWGDVQPLQSIGRTLRGEHFCPVTLAPLGRVDSDASHLADRYRLRHGLDAGTNLLAHFLDLAGLHALAERAADADLGLAAPGGVFAVRNARLLSLLSQAPDALARLEALLRSEPLHRPLLERCWLHLFQQPFVQLQPPGDPLAAPLEVPATMARAMASIDALLARSAPAVGRSTRATRPIPPVGGTGLRLSALDDLRAPAPIRSAEAADIGWWPEPGRLGQVGARLQAHSLG